MTDIYDENLMGAQPLSVYCVGALRIANGLECSVEYVQALIQGNWNVNPSRKAVARCLQRLAWRGVIDKTQRNRYCIVYEPSTGQVVAVPRVT